MKKDNRLINPWSMVGLCLSLVSILIDYQNFVSLTSLSMCIYSICQILNSKKDSDTKEQKGIPFACMGILFFLIKFLFFMSTLLSSYKFR